MVHNIPNLGILYSGTNRVFVESSLFRKQIENLGIHLLRLVQLEILKNPQAGDVITGTGGVRKIRLAKEGRGKSGGYRILYLDLPKLETCHLLLIFAKGEMSNIREADKKTIRALVAVLKKETLS